MLCCYHMLWRTLTIAMQTKVAPAGYSVLHIHRLMPKDTRQSRAVVGSTGRLLRGGGLAIVYRQEFNVTAHQLQSTTHPSTFEYQLTSRDCNTGMLF